MHARLEYDAKADAWTLVDNDSANGSHVNGLRVLSAVLAPGDRVGFGSSEVHTLAVTLAVALIPTLAPALTFTPALAFTPALTLAPTPTLTLSQP